MILGFSLWVLLLAHPHRVQKNVGFLGQNLPLQNAIEEFPGLWETVRR